MTANELCVEIFVAFAGADRPEDSEIVTDNGDIHSEQAEIRDAFKGRRWEELSVAFLTYHRQAVFFFTAKAWSYYLPAYMHAVVRCYAQTDTMVNELIGTILPGRNMDDESRRRARIEALNVQQRAVLLSFIEWVSKEHPEDVDEDDQKAIAASIEMAR